MTKGSTMKKIVLTTSLATVLVFTGLQIADAVPGGKGHGPNQPCIMQGQQLDEATTKARDTFLTETKELRKQVAEKRAAKRAIMKSANPDPQAVAKLAGELFDLREQLRVKATAAGLPSQFMMKMGGMGGGSMMGCNCQQSGCRHHGGNR